MNNKFCDQWEIFLDGDGTANWQEQFVEHLTECSACREQLSQERRWESGLRDHALEMTPTFTWAPDPVLSGSVESKMKSKSDSSVRFARFVAAGFFVAASVLFCVGWAMRIRSDALQATSNQPVTQKGTSLSNDIAVSTPIDSAGHGSRFATNTSGETHDRPGSIVRRIESDSHWSSIEPTSDDGLTLVMLYPSNPLEDDRLNSNPLDNPSKEQSP